MTLDGDARRWLFDLLGDGVVFDEPMARHTSFRVGGPTPALARPKDRAALEGLAAGLRDRSIPFRVVGDGTNLLARDGGLREVVIVLTNALNTIKHSHETADQPCIKAQAGVRLAALCRAALEEGVSGMEMALGIPGTVGGAVRMNAGTNLGAVGDAIQSATFLLPDGRVAEMDRSKLDFRYRGLRGMEDAVVMEAVFQLKRNGASPDILKDRAKKILAARRKRQPDLGGGWSAGCFFKNPPNGPPAGALIDRAGLKGVRVGGAMVSPRHANFIVNTGNAAAADILTLKDRIQETVQKRFGVWLMPEVEIVGEERHPD